MSQLLAQAGPYSLTKTWYVDGTATDVGDVEIGIVDGNGDTVVAAGTSTTNNTDGTYTYTLADQQNPDVLTVTWTRTDTNADLVDQIELVGAWLFTEAQARAFSAKADATSALVPLASATEYPDDTIADERSRIADDLENWTGRGWVPRYCRVELEGNGTRLLWLRDGMPLLASGEPLHRPGRDRDAHVTPLSVTVGGTSKTAADYLIDRAGNLISKGASFANGTSSNPYNVVVEYVYGMPRLVDGVDRIALKLLVDRLVPSAFPDRALSVDTDYGTTRFVQPGGPMHNKSRVPEVNEWVHSHNYRIPVGL